MPTGAARSSAAAGLLMERLNRQIMELAELDEKYTPAHPLVQQKQDQIEATRKQMAAAATNGAAPASIISAFNSGPGSKPYDPQQDIIRTKLLSVGEGSMQLRTRLHQAQLIHSDPPGMADILEPASMQAVATNR